MAAPPRQHLSISLLPAAAALGARALLTPHTHAPAFPSSSISHPSTSTHTDGDLAHAAGGAAFIVLARFGWALTRIGYRKFGGAGGKDKGYHPPGGRLRSGSVGAKASEGVLEVVLGAGQAALFAVAVRQAAALR